MIIKKESSLIDFFEKILQRKEDYMDVSTNYILGKGIDIELKSYYNQDLKAFIKDDSVDFNCHSCCIDGLMFISVICSLLSKKDEVELQYIDNNLVVDSKHKFQAYDKKETQYYNENDAELIISWDKDEFSKIGEDFYFSSGNYSVEKKYGNLINIYISNGVANKYCPSYELIKFSKSFYGKLSDQVNKIHQMIINIKRNAWEFLKDKNNIKLYAVPETYFIADDILIKYENIDFNYDRIEQYLKLVGDDKNVTINKLKNIYKNISIDADKMSNTDNNILSVTDNGSLLNMKEVSVNIDEKVDIDFGIDYLVLKWIVENLPEDSKISFIENENLIKIDNKDDTYFCCLCR